MTAVRTSAMPPATWMVVPEGLEFDHGLTLTRPSPVIRRKKKKLTAGDTTAPAEIAAQDTEEMADSSGMTTASDVTVDMASFSASACPGDTPEPTKQEFPSWFRQRVSWRWKSFPLERSGTRARFST